MSSASHSASPKILSSDTLRGMRFAAEKSLFYLCRSILGFKWLTPDLHQQMCQFLSGMDLRSLENQTLVPNEADPHKRLMIVPRDFCKTTIVKSQIIHCLIQPESDNIYFPGMPGTDVRIIIASETSKNASRHLRNIEQILEKNPLIHQLWPHVQRGSKWSDSEMELRRTATWSEPTIEAVGRDTALASRHVDWIFEDDIFTFEAFQSPTVAETTLTWHHLLEPILDETENKHSRQTMTCTPWAVTDPAKLVLDREEERQAESLWPEWAVYHRSAIESGVSIWPERFPLKRLKNIEWNLRGTGLWELNYMCSYHSDILNDLNINHIRKFSLAEGNSLAILAS